MSNASDFWALDIAEEVRLGLIALMGANFKFPPVTSGDKIKLSVAVVKITAAINFTRNQIIRRAKSTNPTAVAKAAAELIKNDLPNLKYFIPAYAANDPNLNTVTTFNQALTLLINMKLAIENMIKKPATVITPTPPPPPPPPVKPQPAPPPTPPPPPPPPVAPPPPTPIAIETPRPLPVPIVITIQPTPVPAPPPTPPPPVAPPPPPVDPGVATGSPSTGIDPGVRGGGGGCVVLDAFLPAIETNKHNDRVVEKAWQYENNFDILLADDNLVSRTGKVVMTAIDYQPCVKIVTESNIKLSCSTTAPILTKDKGYVESVKLFGERIAVMRNGIAFYDEVVSIEDIGYKHVRVIDTGNNSFWAGDTQNAYILHHNINIRNEFKFDKV